MEERNDINKFRQRRKYNKFAIWFGVALIVVLAVLLIVLNWNAIISPFKDAALNIGDGGYPVLLPGSTEYRLKGLGENFCLLTDTYLYTYNNDGAAIENFQHGFQNPCAVSSDKRVLVYDFNGKGLRMFSKSAELFSENVDDSIVFAEIGSERCAVITTSSRYANYLYVFNDSGKQIFRWASPEGKIMRVCFSDNDDSIYVSIASEKNGELVISVLRFDLNNAESAVWETPIGSSMTYSIDYSREGIYVVTSTGALMLDVNSGEINARTSFSKSVTGIPAANGMRVVLFRDSASNGEIIVSYDDKLDAKNSVALSEVTAFDVYGGRLYLLSGTELTIYNPSLDTVKIFELDDDYADLTVADGCVYLLGYNTVQRVEV